MSIFASQTQRTIAIPFDAPHTVTIRKLTGRETEQAQEAHAVGVASGGARLWSRRFRHLLEHGASDTDATTALMDPLLGFDRFAVIRAGLVGWTYEQSVKGERAHGVIDPIDDLDDEAADFIATEIMRLTKPALFEAPTESRKNDSGSSTEA